MGNNERIILSIEREVNNMTRKVLEVANKEEAFWLASEMISGDFCYDPSLSCRTGYPIYTANNGKEWISDLGCRLEVNTTFGSRNIWIIDRADQIRKNLVALSKSFGYTV